MSTSEITWQYYRRTTKPDAWLVQLSLRGQHESLIPLPNDTHNKNMPRFSSFKEKEELQMQCVLQALSLLVLQWLFVIDGWDIFTP